MTKTDFPNPSAVPPKHTQKVLDHVMGQFGYRRDPNLTPHYWPKDGTFSIGEGDEPTVSFVRQHDESVSAEPHGLDLSE